jgi:hypothetical protein
VRVALNANVRSTRQPYVEHCVPRSSTMLANPLRSVKIGLSSPFGGDCEADPQGKPCYSADSSGRREAAEVAHVPGEVLAIVTRVAEPRAARQAAGSVDRA